MSGAGQIVQVRVVFVGGGDFRGEFRWVKCGRHRSGGVEDVSAWSAFGPEGFSSTVLGVLEGNMFALAGDGVRVEFVL